MRHTHAGTALTFGCPACIARVQDDQRRATLDEQPLRPLCVEWHASVYQSGTVVIDAQYLDDETPQTVADRYEAEIHALIKDEPIFDNDKVDWDIDRATFGDLKARRGA